MGAGTFLIGGRYGCYQGPVRFKLGAGEAGTRIVKGRYASSQGPVRLQSAVPSASALLKSVHLEKKFWYIWNW